MNSEESALDELYNLDCFRDGVSCGTDDDLFSSFLEMAISIVEIREGGLVTGTDPNLVWILCSVGVFRLFPLSVLLHEESCPVCLMRR